MRDLLASSRRLPPEHFSVIRDWKDPRNLPHPIENSWRREQNIPSETFVAMFGGTLGHVSGAEVLVETADLLRRSKGIELVCVGEGVRKHGMIHAARQRGIDNIRFLPFQSGDRVAEVQAAANLTLLTIQPGYSDASFPSKLISYLAAGRPVVCAAPESSGAARLIKEAKAGLVIPPGDAEAMAAAILRLAGDVTECLRMGVNARRYFETHFTLNRAHEQFGELLEEVTSDGRARQNTTPVPAF